MSALWLLPVVALVVASSDGGELAQALTAHTTTGALTTLASATCTLSVGLGLASAILVVYLCRLVLYGFPAGSAGVLSACVPLGPMGQAGVAALLLGKGARALIPVAESNSPFLSNSHAGESVYAVCVCAALAQWALATMWMGCAVLGVQYNVRRMGAPPFQLAYWGLIFPNVYGFAFLSYRSSRLSSSQPTGRICESDDLVGSSARCVVFPRLGRNLRRLYTTALERRVLQDRHPGSQWMDIRRSVFTGG